MRKGRNYPPRREHSKVRRQLRQDFPKGREVQIQKVAAISVHFGSEFFRSAALGEGRFLSEAPNGAGREVNQTLPLETLVAEEFLQIQPCVGLDFPFYKLLFELAALEVNHAV